MSLVIAPNKQQALSMKQQLQLLALPTNKRVLLLKKLGRTQRAKALKRIRQQKTVDGQSFTPRSNGKKQKMLKRLGQGLEPYVMSGQRLELKHKKAFTGRIAAFQQSGGREQMSARDMARIHGKPDYEAPCSRSQAKALATEGYRVKRAKGHGYRKASIKELMTRFSQGQAGFILRKLRNKRSQSSWSVAVPARPYLGDAPANVQAEIATLLSQIRG
ncbi:hypothetical protein [Shewanella marina]|uniref:hypothetical protein n=1 Tax=Shewanella marina TaxID=487319 RepID=UPI00046FD42A|nr:hypothetical protein [Shewanella marina]